MLILRRFLAAGVDGLILGIYLVCFAYFVFDWEIVSPGSAVVPLIVICAPVIYFAFFDSGFGGSCTVGKRLTGLRIVTRDLQPVTMNRSIVRSIIKVGFPAIVTAIVFRLYQFSIVLNLALMLFSFIVVPVSICVGRGAIGLHDAVAGTLVSNQGCAVTGLRSNRLYAAKVFVFSALLSLPVPFVISLVWQAWNLPRLQSSMQATSEAIAPILDALWDIPAAANVSSYVKYLNVNPGGLPMLAASSFPSEFTTSPSREFARRYSSLRGQGAVMSVRIEVTRSGSESLIVKDVLLQHVKDTLPRFLVPIPDQGEFV